MAKKDSPLPEEAKPLEKEIHAATADAAKLEAAIAKTETAVEEVEFLGPKPHHRHHEHCSSRAANEGLQTDTFGGYRFIPPHLRHLEG
jgi:hypothetical protein